MNDLFCLEGRPLRLLRDDDDDDDDDNKDSVKLEFSKTIEGHNFSTTKEQMDKKKDMPHKRVPSVVNAQAHAEFFKRPRGETEGTRDENSGMAIARLEHRLDEERAEKNKILTIFRENYNSNTWTPMCSFCQYPLQGEAANCECGDPIPCDEWCSDELRREYVLVCEKCPTYREVCVACGDQCTVCDRELCRECFIGNGNNHEHEICSDCVEGMAEVKNP